MPGHAAVVVVDLEHDALAGDLDQAEVVLAVRIVVGGEAVERLDRGVDRNFGLEFEGGDAAGHDDVATLAGGTQLVIQCADALCCGGHWCCPIEKVDGGQVPRRLEPKE